MRGGKDGGRRESIFLCGDVALQIGLGLVLDSGAFLLCVVLFSDWTDSGLSSSHQSTRQ